MKTAIIRSSIICLLVLASQAMYSQTKTKWVAPASALSVKNPVSGDQAALKEGKMLYGSNCAACHGEKGRGDGAAAAALTPKPADHSSAAVQSESDGSLYWKLSEGKNPMPSYRSLLSDKQRWSLVSYIRTLKRK